MAIFLPILKMVLNLLNPLLPYIVLGVFGMAWFRFLFGLYKKLFVAIFKMIKAIFTKMLKVGKKAGKKVKGAFKKKSKKKN